MDEWASSIESERLDSNPPGRPRTTGVLKDECRISVVVCEEKSASFLLRLDALSFYLKGHSN